jgi:flagellar basal-body rod protein FlgB
VIPYGRVDAPQLLLEGMRVAAGNQRIIANNIANADTPNFNPVELDFQATLRAAIEGRSRVQLRTTRARHLDATREVSEFERLAILSKNDYNKVDLEHEMASLSKNTGRYTTYGSLLAKHFSSIRNMLDNLR